MSPAITATTGATTARSCSNRLRLVLRSFSLLTITAADPQVRLDPSTGNWSAKIQIDGTGGELAGEVIARVNSLTKPFELDWRRESWKPWDWKLIRVRESMR